MDGINILGSKWKIKKKYISAEEDGYTDVSKKVIIVNPKAKEYNRVLRHEIIHAFMFESGLGFNFEHPSIGVDETMVDWYAIQYPKIRKVFKKLNIEE